MRNKVSLKGKIITLIVLPIFLPLMVPTLLKHIFYNISLITEAIGSWFEQIDFYIGMKSKNEIVYFFNIANTNGKIKNTIKTGFSRHNKIKKNGTQLYFPST